MSFSRIAAATPKTGQLVRFVVSELPLPTGFMSLWVEHLGETNHPYWLDLLARAKANAEELAVKGKTKKPTPTVEEVAKKVVEARAELRETVAKFAVRKLENVFKDDGSPATDDDIRALVLALPDDVFDRLADFCQNANNFRDSAIASSASDVAGK